MPNFSANHRSLLYLKKYDNRISSIIHFRFLISILIIALSLFLILFLKFENTFFLFVLSSLICLQWISEIFLTIKEKNKKYDFLNKILSVNIFFFSIILFFIFFNYIDLMKYSIIFLILSYLFIFKKEFKELKLNIKSLELSKNILKYIFKNYEIISSFSLNFSNLIWRFSIFLLAGKSVAGLLFGSYAIGSFFGTIYYNILGPKIHSKKITFSKIWQILIFLATLVLLFFSFNYLKNFENINQFDLVRKSCILFSLSGSFIMIFSLIIRFNYFYNNSTKKIFKLDIIYSVLIAFVILIIFNLLGSKYLVLAYFVASLCSLSVYSLVNLKNEKFY